MKCLIFLIVVYKYGLYTAASKTSYNKADTFTSDFSSFIKTHYFVDKTELIADFFAVPQCGILISAPRRFGKSTNLDMVKRFCALQILKDGTRIPKQKTDNYKLFTQNNFRIYDPRPDSIFNKHFGEYPVLSLTFKYLSGENFSKFLESFRNMVHDQFRWHSYLLKTDCLNEDETKQKFNKFYREKNILKLSEFNLLISLKFLTEILYKHFEKKVIVFIDEYDVPIQDAIFEAGTDQMKIIHFIIRFTTDLLKDNPYVEKALINTCVRVSGVLTQGANNINVYRFAEDHPFNLYYGLTEDEVMNLCKKFKCNDDEMGRVREWYDGYNVENSKIKLYSVWSIVHYMDTKEFDNYWAQPDYALNLQDICLHDNVFTKVMSLLSYHSINIEIIDKISIKQVCYLRDLILNPTNMAVEEEDADLYLNLMLDLGYFTVVNYTDRKHYNITIPNFEIREEIMRNLESYKFISLKFKMPINYIKAYLQSLSDLKEEKSCYENFGKSVHGLFKTPPMNEKDFQSKLFALPFIFSYLTIESYIELHVPSTGKYIDNLFIRKKDHTGIIIELKCSSLYFNMSYKGLCQIVGENKYYEIFNEARYKVKTMIFISIDLNELGECSLSYLFNTTDINKAVNIIC